MRPWSFRHAAAVYLPACFSVCLFGLAVGCDAENTSSGATTVSVGTFEADLANAFCTWQMTCESAVDLPTCEGRASVAIKEQLALVATAVDEGLISIDATAETLCTTAYGKSACPPPATPNVQTALAGCSGLLTGYVPVGERCDMSAECVAQSFCLSQGPTPQNVTLFSGSGTLGVCFAYQEMGAPCNVPGDCDPTLTCDTATLTCQPP